jgi:DNA-binding CsgD family transcriptional regulator
MDEARFDALVASIYQAAAGRVAWREPLDALADAFDSPRAILTGIDPATWRPFFRDEGGRCDAKAICDSVRCDHAEDPFLARLLHAPPGEWLFADEAPALVAPSYAPRALAPPGLDCAAGVRLDAVPSAVVLALTRARRRPTFDHKARDTLARLGFHFGMALGLEARRSAPPVDELPGIDATAGSRHPLWLVDGHRRVHLRNAAAETLRERGDRLVEIDGRLHCADPREDTELTCALVRLELGHRGGPARPAPRHAVLRVGGVEPGAHAVLLTQRASPGEHSPVLATVRCHPLQHDAEPDPALVAEAFELTPAEARVAAQLARGLSAQEIAAGRGVSMQTIRAQIRAVFEKTGINRQSDLVRLLVEMPDAGRGARPPGPAPHGDDPPGDSDPEGRGDRHDA